MMDNDICCIRVGISAVYICCHSHHPNISGKQFVDGGGWHCYDVEQMIEPTPSLKLITWSLTNKLCRVLGWAWHEHADDGDSVVLVYWQHHPGPGPTWHPSLHTSSLALCASFCIIV
jgi:hypothetical protein